MLLMSTVNTFTLIFKDKFTEVNLSATNASLIINTNSVVGMAMGIVVGPLLKLLGYRRVSVIGGIFFTLGVVLTSHAENLTSFLLTYSIMTGKFI